MKKRSVRVSGHHTSITLEEEFWVALKEIACCKKQSVTQLVSEIDESRDGNLSSAIRIYILQHYRNKS